jgi:hypothetical protein
MKSTPKIRLNHLLLSITFNDKYWRFKLGFLHLSVQHNNKGRHEKKPNLNISLLLLLSLWPKKLWFLYTGAFFWSTLPCFHTSIWISPLWLSHNHLSPMNIQGLHNNLYLSIYSLNLYLSILTICQKMCSCIYQDQPLHYHHSSYDLCAYLNGLELHDRVHIHYNVHGI